MMKRWRWMRMASRQERSEEARLTLVRMPRKRTINRQLDRLELMQWVTLKE